MSWLTQTTPINLQEEKEKFFADPTYNPQFLYDEEVPSEMLDKYGLPQKKYLDLAQAILDKTYFGRNEQDLLMMEGQRVSQEEVTQKFKDFLEMHKIEKKIQIIWSSSFISR